MVTSDFLVRRLELVDTTLRDGEQAAGVAFSTEEKKAIAQKLAAIGIAEIEVGTPASGDAEMQAIREIVEMNLDCRLTGWCRANQYDLDCAHACGLTSVHISLPVSTIHLQALGKNKEWVLSQIQELVVYARRNFEFVSLGLQDASRADLDFLMEFVRLAETVGADRIRLADTVGVWDPMQTYQALTKVRENTSHLLIGFHAHNDLGMATANTLAAIRAGADTVDVTVNGLGERAGNACLDEVVMATRVSLGLDCGIDTQELVSLAVLVEAASGRLLPVNKPITGRSVFLHESGIHVHAMLQDRRAYEPFEPNSVGQKESEFVLGKHSGRTALRHILSKQGLSVNCTDEEMLMDLIRRSAVRHKENQCLESYARQYRTAV